MSEDTKKRDRALQRRVRERQQKTGESYQAAWRQLTGSDAPPDDEQDLGGLVADQQTQLMRINTQMFEGTIRVLGESNKNLHEQMQALTAKYDQLAAEVKAKEAQAETPKTSSDESSRHRIVLPLSTTTAIPQQQPTRVISRAAQGAVDIEQIHISNAGTAGGAADWIVNDIEIDGRSQLALKDLSGALFGDGVAANPRARATFSINGFDTVERGQELALVVTYVGENHHGCPFFALATGKKPPQRPTIVPIASKTPLPPQAKTTITARVQNASFQVTRLEIENGDTPGGAADWIVGDLRINGRSQFVHSGDVPGDLFATGAIDTFVKLSTCEAGNTIEVDVIYTGLIERGAIFTALLEGTVTRADYSVPPPDLHVTVETSGQEPAESVVGRCNWRAPATDNSTR